MEKESEKPIIIIGAGIVGLFTAYYLQLSGRKAILIDKSDGLEGCSFGNAGMVVPSHFIPLAAPGMIEKGLKWMFDSESPFYVKPRLSLSLLKWGINFYKSANQKKVDEAIPALRDLGLLSKSLYQELHKANLFDFSFEEKGLMMYCKTSEALEEEAHVAEIANKIGIEAQIKTKEEIAKLEPEVLPNVAGGVLFPGDTHLYPNALVKNLKKYLIQKGIEFYYNSEVIDFVENGNKIEKVKLKKNQKEEILNCSDIILAAGSWSEYLAKKLQLNLPIQAGKGYSLTLPQRENKKINIPSIFVEARVAITPMAESLVRFGGTMEIGGINDHLNMNRVNGIIKSIPKYYPHYEVQIPKKEEVWYGLRPCSPDGLPYIGKISKFKNLYINSGHAMMGISLASGSGKLMAEILNNSKSSIAIHQFDAQRFD
jgi:D-amino-acid dehydrogenase